MNKNKNRDRLSQESLSQDAPSKDSPPKENPLLQDVLEFLGQHPQGLREYDLLEKLSDHPAFQAIQVEPPLALFQKHFLLMNALYQLRLQLREQNRDLKISPLQIQLIPRSQKSRNNLTERNYPDIEVESDLSAYYLDWNNFDQTDGNDVQKLLDDFWKRFFNVDAREGALRVLELENDASSVEVRQRYRELAARFHPDKGGSAEEFMKIREAYEILVEKE